MMSKKSTKKDSKKKGGKKSMPFDFAAMRAMRGMGGSGKKKGMGGAGKKKC